MLSSVLDNTKAFEASDLQLIFYPKSIEKPCLFYNKHVSILDLIMGKCCLKRLLTLHWGFL